MAAISLSVPQTFSLLIPLHIHYFLPLLWVLPSVFQLYPPGQYFPPKRMVSSGSSFPCTIPLINYIPFFAQDLPGRELGSPDQSAWNHQTTDEKKERKVVQVREENGTHTLIWECRWAYNAFCKNLETIKLLDGRIRLHEWKERTKPWLCRGHCTEMERRKNASKGSSKQ